MEKESKVTFYLYKDAPKGVSIKEVNKGKKVNLTFRDYNGWKYSVVMNVIEKDDDGYVLEVTKKNIAVVLKAKEVNLGVIEGDIESLTVEAIATVKEEVKVEEVEEQPAKEKEDMAVTKKEEVVIAEVSATVTTDQLPKADPKDAAKVEQIEQPVKEVGPGGRLDNRMYSYDEVVELIQKADDFWDIPYSHLATPDEDLTDHIPVLEEGGQYTLAEVAAVIQSIRTFNYLHTPSKESCRGDGWVRNTVDYVADHPVKTTGIVSGTLAVLGGLAYLGAKLLGGSDEQS